MLTLKTSIDYIFVQKYMNFIIKRVCALLMVYLDFIKRTTLFNFVDLQYEQKCKFSGFRPNRL